MEAMSEHYLKSLFIPASVAVVGASPRAASLGKAVLGNLRAGGFSGPILAINPKYAEIDGQPCYPDFASLPAPPDLAVVVTPAATVAAVLADAARAGTRHAVVLTAGFGELGPNGKALEMEVARSARTNGLRMIGPNCLGLMRPDIGLNATFSRSAARAGQIALVSQSGAICAALTDWAWSAGIGFSSVVSLGAGTDLDFGEVLDFLMHDEATTSILMYVEGVRDARRFISGLRAAARTKPIVVLKAGRHATASLAAQSHTGALAGNDAVFDAVLRRSGVVRAESYPELFAAARLLAAGRLPRSNRLAVLTNGGGPGVMAADCAATHDVALAALTPRTLQALDSHLPAHWSHGNPVDIIGDATAQRFSDALGALLDDPQVDGVLTLFCPQIVTTAEAAAQALLPHARASGKPVLTGWLGEAQVRTGRELIEAAGMPAFQSPESGVIGFAALAGYVRAQELLREVPPPLAATSAPDIDGAFALARKVAEAGRTLLNEPESKALLNMFGIATPPTRVAHTLVEAIAFGEALQYPLAMKIVSQDIAHKSDVQGVVLNVRDLPALERAFRNLMARVAKARPDARIEGVAIQPMVEKRFGRELMIGVARDATFGQVISFGAGGVAVELLRDNAIGLPPLNRRLAEDLIERTRVSRLLGAYRHVPAANHEALIDMLLRVSEMVCALPWLTEMDINPLSVDADSAVALDARVVIDPTRLDGNARYAHMAIHPYPAALETAEVLRSGTAMRVRPIRPEDAEMERQFVEELSDEARHMRFFSSMRTLPPRLLARLTQVDYERELALLGLCQTSGGEEMVGIARYSPNADGISCEFAVTVGDAWQGHGIATMLMQRLMTAAIQAGYQRMVGLVLSTNAPMHKLMRALGFAGMPSADDPGAIEYSRELEVTTSNEAKPPAEF